MGGLAGERAVRPNGLSGDDQRDIASSADVGRSSSKTTKTAVLFSFSSGGMNEASHESPVAIEQSCMS